MPVVVTREYNRYKERHYESTPLSLRDDPPGPPRSLGRLRHEQDRGPSGKAGARRRSRWTLNIFFPFAGLFCMVSAR